MSESFLQTRLRKANLLHYGKMGLRAGGHSEVYADIKKAYGHPDILSHLARVMVRGMDVRTSLIAASGHGGIPLATAMSLQSELPLALVRDTPKGHGIDKLIDGHMPEEGDLVSLVDDVYTSGSSLAQTITAIEDTGAEVIGCNVIVARTDTSSFPYPVSHLFTLDDLRAE